MSNITFHYNDIEYSLTTWGEDDYIHRDIEKEKTFFEVSTLEFIRSRRLRGAFVDIGANIGNHTVYFANECKPSLVFAIDCNPEIQPIILDNLARNNRNGVPMWWLASCISSNEKVFFNCADNDNVGMSFVSEVPVKEGSTPMKATRLDDVCVGIPRLDFIKIDVEYHEPEVLESARETIRRHRPEICVEALGANLPRIEALLAAQGYTVLRRLNHTNWYFVHVGRSGLAVQAFLEKLPDFLSERLVWRWRKVLVWARTRPKRRPAPVPSEVPPGVTVLNGNR